MLSWAELGKGFEEDLDSAEDCEWAGARKVEGKLGGLEQWESPWARKDDYLSLWSLGLETFSLVPLRGEDRGILVWGCLVIRLEVLRNNYALMLGNGIPRWDKWVVSVTAFRHAIPTYKEAPSWRDKWLSLWECGIKRGAPPSPGCAVCAKLQGRTVSAGLPVSMLLAFMTPAPWPPCSLALDWEQAAGAISPNATNLQGKEEHVLNIK